MAVTYNNIAFLHLTADNKPRALEFFIKSRDLYREIGLDKDADEAEEMISNLISGNKK